MVSDAGAQMLGDRDRVARDLRQVVDRFLLLAELQQAGHHVQAVGVLVFLGAQRGGQPVDRAELPDQGLHLRAIA